MALKNNMVVIVGSTGVGKSDFAQQLAQVIKGQIINCDMGQLYEPLTIGTAKPDWQNAPIKHNLFGILSTPDSMTVSRYRELLLQTIASLPESVTPIVVGGSGFYVQSLFYPPIGTIADQSGNTANDNNLWDQLNAIDPVRAAAINKADIYRLKRALSIWHSAGTAPSTFVPSFKAPTDNFNIIVLTRDRVELYDRINARVGHMFNQGWIDEVKGLQGTEWEPFLRSKKIIGYAEIFDYLQAGQTHASKQRLQELIAQKTRNYAKRQLTYWRMMALKTDFKDKITSLNLTLCDVDLYISQLSQDILKKL